MASNFKFSGNPQPIVYQSKGLAHFNYIPQLKAQAKGAAMAIANRQVVDSTGVSPFDLEKARDMQTSIDSDRKNVQDKIMSGGSISSIVRDMQNLTQQTREVNQELNHMKTVANRRQKFHDALDMQVIGGQMDVGYAVALKTKSDNEYIVGRSQNPNINYALSEAPSYTDTSEVANQVLSASSQNFDVIQAGGDPTYRIVSLKGEDGKPPVEKLEITRSPEISSNKAALQSGRAGLMEQIYDPNSKIGQMYNFILENAGEEYAEAYRSGIVTDIDQRVDALTDTKTRNFNPVYSSVPKDTSKDKNTDGSTALQGVRMTGIEGVTASTQSSVLDLPNKSDMGMLRPTTTTTQELSLLESFSGLTLYSKVFGDSGGNDEVRRSYGATPAEQHKWETTSNTFWARTLGLTNGLTSVQELRNMFSSDPTPGHRGNQFLHQIKQDRRMNKRDSDYEDVMEAIDELEKAYGSTTFSMSTVDAYSSSLEPVPKAQRTIASMLISINTESAQQEPPTYFVLEGESANKWGTSNTDFEAEIRGKTDPSVAHSIVYKRDASGNIIQILETAAPDTGAAAKSIVRVAYANSDLPPKFLDRSSNMPGRGDGKNIDQGLYANGIVMTYTEGEGSNAITYDIITQNKTDFKSPDTGMYAVNALGNKVTFEDAIYDVAKNGTVQEINLPSNTLADLGAHEYKLIANSTDGSLSYKVIQLPRNSSESVRDITDVVQNTLESIALTQNPNLSVEEIRSSIGMYAHDYTTYYNLGEKYQAIIHQLQTREVQNLQENTN